MDPKAQTTLSDEEVIYEERQGSLYYIEYAIEGSDERLTIATTRPETILGDSAICGANPNDERFSHLKGKKQLFLCVIESFQLSMTNMLIWSLEQVV